MNYKPLTDVRYLVVHCSATPAKMDIGVKEIDLWHRARGFFSIGYHVVIRRNGSVEFGRPLGQPGAHAADFNSVSRAVCLVGGVDVAGNSGKAENNFTPAQFATLYDVLHAWKDEFPHADIVGHRDLFDRNPDGSYKKQPGQRLKDCPSFDVQPWAKLQGLLP